MPVVAGARRYRANVEQHDGTVDRHGNPDYADDNWDVQITGWPCEILTVRGGELVRGRQVTAETTHLFFGEYHGAKTVTTDMRLVVNSTTYNIVSVIDSTGLNRELRIEAKIEQ